MEMQTLEKETKSTTLPKADDYASSEKIDLIHIKNMAMLGDGHSQYELALICNENNNKYEAELWGIRATKNCIADAADLVATIKANEYEEICKKYVGTYRFGEKEKLLREIIYWFDKANELGHPLGQFKSASCKCSLAELYINGNYKNSGRELYQEAANDFYEIEEYSQAANCYSVLASYEYPNEGEFTKKLIELANKHNDPVALYSLGERCLKDIRENDIPNKKWVLQMETAIKYLSKAKDINEIEPKLSENQADNCVGHLDNSLFKLSKYYCSKGNTLKANELFQKITFKRYYKDEEDS